MTCLWLAQKVQNFCRCLLQIRVIRGVHEQLVRLLSQSEQKELRIKESFSPFSGQNPLQYNPYTEPLWRAAVDQYNRAMAPAEQRIAGKLRNQFRGLEQNSQQVTTLHPMVKLRLYIHNNEVFCAHVCFVVISK